MSVAAPHVGECRQEGWSSQLLLFKRCSDRGAHSLPGKQRSWPLMRPGMWSRSQSSQSPRRCSLSIKLSMLLPVQWTALRRFVWTVLAPARSPAALRLSAAGSPGSEGLARLGELPRVSRTHGGRRHGQGWGHGDGPWLRPYQREHPGHQSGDHRVLQVSPVRRWCCYVCVSAARFWCVKLSVLVRKINGPMFYFIVKIITLNILRNNKTLQRWN